MNGIEKITQRIKDDARLEITAVAEQTKAQCEKILADSRAKAELVYWETVKEGKQEAEHLLELRKGAAQSESKKRMLQLKQDMLAEAFAAAESKLRALSGAEYEKFLVSLAVRASGSGTEKIVLSAADREKYGQRVVDAANKMLAADGRTASLTLAVESRDIEGGLVLTNGKIETNCSIKNLLEQRRAELTPAAAKLLFG